jgi:hypothetical protein
MAEALILDSEALNALANPGERGALALRMRAVLQIARDHSAVVRVPAPVLAEVCRSPKLDAAVNRVLGMKGIVVAELTERIARRAGHLLARARLASDHAVDAFVVATALDFPDSLIATGDVGNIESLAAGFKQVRTFRI